MSLSTASNWVSYLDLAVTTVVLMESDGSCGTLALDMLHRTLVRGSLSIGLSQN